MQLHIQRGTEELGTFTLEETTQYLSEGSLFESDLARYEKSATMSSVMSGSWRRCLLNNPRTRLNIRVEVLGTWPSNITIPP